MFMKPLKVLSKPRRRRSEMSCQVRPVRDHESVLSVGQASSPVEEMRQDFEGSLLNCGRHEVSFLDVSFPDYSKNFGKSI